MTDTPKVTQADRETYAELFSPFPDECSRVMAGECDDYDEIQIIARHRENAVALQAENARLREELKEAKNPHWFYYGDDCSYERCRFSVYECIDEDFLWDNSAEGDHVLCISGARPVPDIWVALRFFTEEEKNARDSDDDYAFTEHATEEEARAALTKENQDD